MVPKVQSLYHYSLIIINDIDRNVMHRFMSSFTDIKIFIKFALMEDRKIVIIMSTKFPNR